MSTKITVEASCDDGAQGDLRVAELMEKYGIPCTFYIPINYRKYRTITDHDLRELAKKHTIGGHGVEHYILRSIPEHIAKQEIELSREILRIRTGQEINSFCYPRGRYNDIVKQMVKDAGYTEARTTKVLETTREYDPYEKPTTIHIFDKRTEYQGKSIIDVAKEQAEIVKSNGGIFHTWMHGWEVDRYNLWDDLEEVLKIMAELK